MNEIIKRDVKKGELQYLDGIYNLQKKHMDLLTDLIKRPSLGKEITELTVKKDIILDKNLIYTEIDHPYKKMQNKSEEEK